MEHSEHLSTVHLIHRAAQDGGLSYLTAEDDAIRGRSLRLHGRDVLSFASCSYLGLEQHPALIEGAVEAARRYGTMFSYSRYYVAAPPYAEMNALLTDVFGGHVLITQSTSMGHLTVLPVIATERDAIVVDHQAHMSIQMAVTVARARGATVETVRHYEMDERLLETVARLARTHRRVYVAVDGVYSMYGDLAPVGLLAQALAVAPNVRLYVDDAHGMSWAGERGRGWFLSQMPLTERVVVGTSLVKAFAAAGGCFVFADPDERDYVRLTGAPYIYSGPIQPPMMGAIIASAQLHLSPELQALQQAFRERVAYTNALIAEHDLPLLSWNDGPIFFFRIGKVEAAQTLARRLLADGCYVSVSNYPTVPLKRAGLRLTVTATHTPAEIRQGIETIAHHLPRVLDEFGIDRGSLDSLFARAIPAEARGTALLGSGAGPRRHPTSPAAQGQGSGTAARLTAGLTVDVYPSVAEACAAIGRTTWDAAMAHRGLSSHDTLAATAAVCRAPGPREHVWSQYALVARAPNGAVAGLTYATRALAKDDMFMRAEVSQALEAHRAAHDPYFCTSDTLTLGSPFSEGEHIAVLPGQDPGAVRAALVEAVEELGEALDVDAVVLRDFADGDAATDAWMHGNDWMKVPIVPAYTIPDVGATEEAFVERIAAASNRPHRVRRFWRGLRAASATYTVRVHGVGGSSLPEAWWPHLHALYREVAERTRRINDFGFPAALWPTLLASAEWEVLTLHRAAGHEGSIDDRPVAWVLAYRQPGHYTPVVCGVNYAYVEGQEFGAYRQILLATIRRARALEATAVSLGFGADVEKRRLGAEPRPTCTYVRARHHDHGERLQAFVETHSLGRQPQPA